MPAAPASAPEIPLPPEPQSVEQTGLSISFLADLALKTLYLRGQMTMSELSTALGLPITNVTDKVMEFLKAERLVEIRGGTGLSSAGYQFVIVDRGSEKAQEALNRSGYVGKAPVPLATYIAAVQRQTVSNITVSQEELARAFAHMVIPRETLGQLGPAINSGRSIFLFGPPGNGKTTIAEVLVSLLRGEVVLPYAVEVDQQVIKVYDQVYHRAALDPVVADRLRFDHRWIVSKRPIVMTGGELTLETLDLIYDETSKFYEAPFQMKANGGIFMVDDFGRQRVSPKDLLNRWIVPLEKRVDYLTLHTGKKIEIPFDMLIVFFDQPRSGGPRRRGLPPPDPLQDRDRGAHRGAVRGDLQADVRPEGRRVPGRCALADPRALPPEEPRPPLVPPARHPRATARHRALPRPAGAALTRPHRHGLRVVLRLARSVRLAPGGLIGSTESPSGAWSQRLPDLP